MTTPVSTVPAVKAALLAKLQARADLADVQIEYEPVSTFTDDEMIVLGAVQGRMDVRRMVGSGGAGWLDEAYVLTVSVYVFRGDADETASQTNEERAYALAASVADEVRADPSIGGLVTQANPSSFECVASWDEEHLGMHHRYDLGIAVEASL